ncbi:MAG: glutamate 5-kinase [Nitrospinae bacterium CG11_big_fil_rev_8_21_14_0_20_56_8]|nr:MAG: glutamate 5-kinase [Nitrospinae bacterium CG11_big_fil_rev_8_21_14_0_20_56_8]
MGIETRKKILGKLKRVVIKIGSSVIAHKEPGKSVLVGGLNPRMVAYYARMIKTIVESGRQVVLVSSGAIMAGRKRLGLDRGNLTIPEKQACAAIGQSFLMHTYEKQFEKQGLKVAQILLGSDDLEHRRRYLNAKHTIEALLEHNVIPIINENDSVTVDEIKIGDNDTLSATVACLVDAGLLIVLSDVEGLYSRDPGKVRKGEAPPELISQVEQVTEEIERLAGKSNNRLTVGGMYTKVLAAKKTLSYGIPTLLVNGLDKKVLPRVFSGEPVGTLFCSEKGKIRNRKHWIAHTLKPLGTITVDEGARKALVQMGKSLLPAGVIRVDGNFEFGNPVRILDETSIEIARGLVNYSARDLESIRGKKTALVRTMVGTNFYEEVIHRDDLVILV